ncbi:Transmembrane emp24 domain-containing protein 9 [Aphanomyces cochlioides]|nr:Transmembrane emp24 domain-containing protein 9 [Aphanomyces cochlioides]
MVRAIQVVLGLVCASVVHAAHFMITPDDHKCFHMDIPDGTTFRAEYESPDTNDALKTVMKIYEPAAAEEGELNQTPSISQTLNEKGAIAFTTTKSGEHWACISIDTNKYVVPDTTKMKFKLKLRFGASNEEYANLAKKEQMNELELEVMKLRDRVKAIQKQQDYAQEKGDKFRSSSENNNSRAMWVSVIQIVVLLVAGIWQVHHLQTYFQKKKLV